MNESVQASELTNEMITHLVQHRFHVFTAQTLGTHKALQHPKHATQSSLGSTAGTRDQIHIKPPVGVTVCQLCSQTHLSPPEIPLPRFGRVLSGPFII